MLLLCRRHTVSHRPTVLFASDLHILLIFIAFTYESIIAYAEFFVNRQNHELVGKLGGSFSKINCLLPENFFRILSGKDSGGHYLCC